MKADSIDLNKAARTIMERGPSRVLISADGEATTSRRARENHGIVPDIVFIRRDGWSLGAPEYLEAAAYRLSSDEWVGFMRRPSTKARPIGEYDPPM